MNKMNKIVTIGAFALIGVGTLTGCNNSSTKKPIVARLTTHGTKYVNVDVKEPLEFGKDVEITLSPANKFVHLNKIEYDQANKIKSRVSANPLTPFIGYGNEIYQVKSPLVQDLSFEYKKLEDSFEDYKLTVRGEYFDNSLFVSYLSEDRYYTPEGKKEIEEQKESGELNPDAYGIVSCYQKNDYDCESGKKTNDDDININPVGTLANNEVATFKVDLKNTDTPYDEGIMENASINCLDENEKPLYTITDFSYTMNTGSEKDEQTGETYYYCNITINIPLIGQADGNKEYKLYADGQDESTHLVNKTFSKLMFNIGVE